MCYLQLGTGDQKQIKFQMTVSRVTVNFDIDQPFVGLSIQGQVTGQYGSTGNPLQEAEIWKKTIMTNSIFLPLKQS